MRHTTLAALTLASSLSAMPLWAVAQEKAAESPHSFTGNVALTTDYRYRGMSQSYLRPAVQGGFDYAHSNGFYVGTWASSVSGNSFTNGSSMEWDFYGGYKFPVGDVTMDVGVLVYHYPGAHASNASRTRFDTTELYVGASYKWLSAKYSHSVSNLFGINAATFGGSTGLNSDGTAHPGSALPTTGSSKGSGYYDLTATFDLGDDWGLVAHVGHQKVKRFSALSYTDWKLGVTKAYKGTNFALSYIDTDAEARYYRVGKVGAATDVKDVSKGALVFTVSRTF